MPRPQDDQGNDSAKTVDESIEQKIGILDLESASAQEILDWMFKESELKGQRLYQGLPAASALFAPVSGCDWEPIRCCADVDVIVYADWTIQKQNCADAIRRIESASLLLPPAEDLFLPAAVMAELPWGADRPTKPWVEIAEIGRPGVGLQKPLWLIYIGGNPALAYQVIFSDRSFAPQFIFRPSRPEQVPQDAWSDFFGPQGPFMAVVNANPHRPKGLITDLGAAVW